MESELTMYMYCAISLANADNDILFHLLAIFFDLLVSNA